MKLTNQVVSIELSKRLKELGVKQESYFEWKNGGVLGGQRPHHSEILPRKRPPQYGAANQAFSFYAAFTVAELGEMFLTGYKGTLKFKTYRGTDKEFWISLSYTENNQLSDSLMFSADTEANARAKMLIYLIENKLMKA